MAVTWVATIEAIEAAAAKGATLLVSHEGLDYPALMEVRSGADLVQRKRELLDAHGMALMRCHDVWDRMPEVGIPDAWAEFLGFEAEPRPVESYYRVCLVGERPARELAGAILGKVRALGQRSVRIFGPPDAEVSRMAVGTGAITNAGLMHELGADCILATDDGMWSTTWGVWALDLGIPVLCVSHATAELPGMMKLAEYLAEMYPDTPCGYVPCGFPPATVS